MGLKLGLISDIHASPKPLSEALEIFRQHQVDSILCAGDIAGYGEELEQTVELLIDHGVRSVIGNHDLWYFERRDNGAEGPVADFLRTLPETLDIEAEGCQIHVVHASPTGSLLDGIRLLDEKGTPLKRQLSYWQEVLKRQPAEVLIVGHTHQVFAQQLGPLLVINPGSSLFNHTCAILSLPEKHVEFFPLSGKEPLLSWNFSMFKDISW